MSAINKLIVKSLQERNITLLQAISHLVSGGDKEAIDFINDYHLKYHAIPTIKLIQEEIPNFVALDSNPDGTVLYLFDKALPEIRTTYLNAHIQETLDANGQVDYSKFNELSRRLEVQISKFEEWKELPTEHYSIENTMMQFNRLKWLNDALGGGLSETDMIVLYGRMKTMKSYLLAFMIYDLVVVGKKKVLIFNNEMDNKDFVIRFDAMLLGINPDILRKGKLPESQQKILDERRAKIQGRLVFGGFASSVNKIVAAYSKYSDDEKPDVIAVDAFELIANKGRDNGEVAVSLTQALYELRFFQLEKKIPILLTTQENRSGADRDVQDASTIAGSDSFGRVASAAFKVRIVVDGGIRYQAVNCTASRNADSLSQTFLHYHWDTMSATPHSLNNDGVVEIIDEPAVEGEAAFT